MATHSPRRPRPAGVFWWVGGTPSPPAPLPVGEGERRVFTFTPVIPAPPSFPRRRESTHPCPPETGFYLHPRHSRTPVIPAKAGIHAPLPPRDGFLPSPPSFPHPRHSREGGNPRTPAPQGRVFTFTFTPVIPAPRHSREGGNPRTPAPQGRVFTFTPVIPAPPSFPRRRESTHPCPPETGFYLHPRHSREGGNPRTPVFTFTPVIPAKAGIHAPPAPLPEGEGERGRGGWRFWVKRAVAVWCGEGRGWFTFAATVG